jgi:hypothetical protein
VKPSRPIAHTFGVFAMLPLWIRIKHDAAVG